MTLLALDTSNRILSVALLTDKNTIFSQEVQMERGQGEALLDLIQKLLKKAQKQPQDITAIAVAIGPGSFTGVRIGLATAKAFGLALNIPVWGVTNLEAEAYNTQGNITVVLDSKRDDYFVQHFSNGTATDTPHIELLEMLKNDLPFTAAGDAAEDLKKRIGCFTKKQKTPLAVAVAQIAQNRASDPLPPSPLYLRQADVTV